jgi:hypothetical protein
VIGSASDFYRVRISRVDATEAVDFEWRDDILYRRPPTAEMVEDELYRVEAVLLDDEDVVTPIGTFEDVTEAHTVLQECTDALAEMTKSQFEAHYLSAG